MTKDVNDAFHELKTYIFWNCNLCGFSSFVILSIVSQIIWHIVSQIVVPAKIAVHTEHWSIVSTHVIIECTVAAQIWIVSEPIKSIHHSTCVICIVRIVEIIVTHAAKAIVSELIKIWSIKIAALIWSPWVYEIVAITISAKCINRIVRIVDRMSNVVENRKVRKT